MIEIRNEDHVFIRNSSAPEKEPVGVGTGRSLCSEIFYHVFTDLLPREEDALDRKNLERKLGHILYHLRGNQVNICGIIAADGDGLFMTCFKGYLTQLFSRYTILFSREVPEDFLIHHLAGSFAETVKWWVAQDMSALVIRTRGIRRDTSCFLEK